MPFTPYHFGPNGLVGLVFRRWLDLPVMLLANVAIDLEVLIVNTFELGKPVHRYAHTLIGAVAVGLACGLLCYPLKPIFGLAMNLLRIPYQPRLAKMLAAGVIGAALHVLFDSLTSWDVRIFWPFLKRNPLWRTATGDQLKNACLLLATLAVALWLLTAWHNHRKNPKLTTPRQ